jgi:hypothetical protein
MLKKFFLEKIDVSIKGPRISIDQLQRKLFFYSVLRVFLIGT